MKQPTFPVIIVLMATMIGLVEPFVLFPSRIVAPFINKNDNDDIVLLFAKKKKKKSRRASGSTFGGGAMESCPCGSGIDYSKCCGKLHRDVNAYKSATPEQVVRARYSAYAKKLPDFLMATTHPLNKDFDPDIKRWKETIKQNMYDNFDMNQCTIVEEKLDEEDEDKAEVSFVANLIYRETEEVTAFMETSQLERAKTERAKTGWLYKNGTISSAPTESEDEGDGNNSESSPLSNFAEPIYAKSGAGDNSED